MTLYKTALLLYAHAYTAIENRIIAIAVRYNLDELVTGVNRAKEAAMLQNMDMLISNIWVCKTYANLKACKDMYQMLCLSYADFPVRYGGIVNKAINRKELEIQQSFNNDYKTK